MPRASLRFGPSLAAWAVGGLACDGQPGEDSVLTDPCVTVLVHGEERAPCSSSDEAECEQALRDDTVVFRWRLELVTSELGVNGEVPISEGDLGIRAACLVEALEGAGGEDAWGLDIRDSVSVLGSASQLASLLDLTMLDGFEVECVDEDYCDCRRLEQEACEAHAFCSMIAGEPVDVEQACLAEGQPAGCGVFDGCGDVIVFAVGPDLGCWRFRTDCLPGGFGISSGDDGVCPAEVWSFQSCP